MRRQLCQLAIVAIALGFAVRVTGNSPVGLKSDSAGTAHPRAAKGPRIIKVTELVPGTHVRFHLRNGNAIAGTFVSPGRLSEPTYAARYAAWRSSSADAAGFPGLGDSVAMLRHDGQRTSGAFQGFGWKQVLVRLAPGSVGAEQVAYTDFEALLGGSGDTLAAARLDELERDARLPRITALLMKVDSATIPVAVDDIAVVQGVEESNTGAVVIIVGVAAVVLLAVVLIDSMSKEASCGGQIPVTTTSQAPSAPARPAGSRVGAH